METIMIDLDELKLGSMLSEDILANTNYPIAYKETKITREMVVVFHAFNITEIPIAKDLLGSAKTESMNDLLTQEPATKQAFEEKLAESIQKFKVEFSNWEAGSKVDIVKVRAIIMPLIDEMISDRSKIFTLNDYSDSKEYIYVHAVSMSLVAAVLANKLKYNKGDVVQIATAALLADCGMAKVSKKIRLKPSSLTEHEYKEVMSHPAYSLRMIKDLKLLKSEMKLAVFQHHEKLDGTGYPNKTKGDSISQISHIIAVADIYHAMTSDRLYQSKESIFKVIDIIRESAFGKYRVEVIQALLDCVADIPLGTIVELSNSLIGTIVYTNKNQVTRPVVKVEYNGELLDLTVKRNLHIHKVYI